MAKVSLNDVASEDGAVQNVTLEFADREFVALAGPRGCGARTLLRMIAGLEEIAQGEIVIGERRANEVAAHDRDVAVVFPDGALYPHMSIYDNLAFGLKLRKFGQPEIRKRIDDAATILGFEQFLAQKPGVLSAELRQRVALGRAIVRQPKVFLFDDPLADLDADSRGRMRGEIAKLHQRLGATIIYSTPNPDEAMTLADRIIAISAGEVQQDGSPRALYSTPANLFAAQFFGRPPMNIVAGNLKQERDGFLFTESGEGTIQARLSGSDRPGAAEFAGKPVLLGLRPEDLAIAPGTKGGDAAAGIFPALLDVVEPLGAEAILRLHTGAHDIICRMSIPMERGEAGRRLRVGIDLAKVHLFDPASGARIG